jgi:cytochrome c oxidase cbb3-type subunit I/II
MPTYPWLLRDPLGTGRTAAKVRAMRTLGVPYTPQEVDTAVDTLRGQAREIAAELANAGVQGTEDKEIVALIAYLQRLGTDLKKAPVAAAERAR